MRKIFLDTNIIVDLLAKRVPFYEDAAKLFSLADQHEIELSCSALSIANIYYILFKNKNCAVANTVIKSLFTILDVLPLNDKVLQLSLTNHLFQDFEDSIQHYTAIENNIDVIITRNKKDFVSTVIPVMEPNEIVKYFEN
jgi:predicted nucleic acid-binding protein